MNILKNKTFVIILSVLIVLGSWFGIGVMKTTKEANKVKAVYLNGEDNDNISIANDLAVRESCAQNLATLGAKYLSSSETGSISSINKLITEMKKETDLTELSKLNDQLTEEVGILTDKLGEKELTSENKDSLDEQLSIFTNKGNTILYDNYNVYVQSYKKKTSDPVFSFFTHFAPKVEYFRSWKSSY